MAPTTNRGSSAPGWRGAPCRSEPSHWLASSLRQVGRGGTGKARRASKQPGRTCRPRGRRARGPYAPAWSWWSHRAHVALGNGGPQLVLYCTVHRPRPGGPEPEASLCLCGSWRQRHLHSSRPSAGRRPTRASPLACLLAWGKRGRCLSPRSKQCCHPWAGEEKLQLQPPGRACACIRARPRPSLDDHDLPPLSHLQVVRCIRHARTPHALAILSSTRTPVHVRRVAVHCSVPEIRLHRTVAVGPVKHQ